MHYDKPFFSIIMPIYNGEQYLKKAIKSVLEQTYQNFELILVNDGSKDNSLKICEEFAASDQRVEILDLKINQGLSNARNQGLKQTNGFYVIYVDSDDYVVDDLLEVSYNKIEKFKRPDVIKFGIFEDFYKDDYELSYTNSVNIEQCYLNKKSEIVSNVLRWESIRLFGSTCNTFYKKSTLNKVNLDFQNTSIAEDFFYNLEFFDQVQTVLMLDKPMYHYAKRLNESLSTKYVAEYFDIYTLKVKEMINLCDKNNLKTRDNMQIIADLYGRYIYSMLERNMSKESPYSLKEQKEILKDLYTQKMFNELIHFFNGNGKKEKVMLWFLKHKSILGCFGLTIVIHVIKQYLPILFSRLK